MGTELRMHPRLTVEGKWWQQLRNIWPRASAAEAFYLAATLRAQSGHGRVSSDKAKRRDGAMAVNQALSLHREANQEKRRIQVF